MPDMACALAVARAWAPLFALAAALQLLDLALCRPRMRRTGPEVPDLPRLGTVLRHGRFRGVAVVEEPPGPFGGGRFLPGAGRGQIRLDQGMLARRDVDALAILEHERGHAERDLPAPRPYRLGLVGAFLLGLALALTRPELAGAGTVAMGIAFAIAALHFLRNEAAASEYVLRELWARDWPKPLRRAAVTRLAAAFGRYLAGWSLAGAAVAALSALLVCR